MGSDDNNNPVRIRSGVYGKYLEVGRREDKSLKVYALPKWIPVTVSLHQLLEFVSLPRVIGRHPDPLLESAAVIVDISADTVSVGVDGFPLRVPLTMDGVFPSEVSLEKAMLLLPGPQAILASFRRLGVLNDIPITVEKGRWGDYLRCGNIIPRAPKADKEMITLELAIEYLQKYGKVMGSKKSKKISAKAKAKEAGKSKLQETKEILKQPVAKDKVKRLPGPFIIFCSEKRCEILSSNPYADFSTVAKQLGKMWKELSNEEKSSYITCTKKMNPR